MKIYYKILLATLPTGFLILFVMWGIYSHFTENALTNLAETWLETRVSEGIDMAADQNNNLKQYGLEQIKPSIMKAQLDAANEISGIAVGKQGYLFAVDHQGTIIFNPDPTLVGRNVSGESWFQDLEKRRGSITFEYENGPHLAFYGYFEPWKWFIIATDPYEEFFGAAQRIKPLMLILGIVGFFVMATTLMMLTLHITRSLDNLTKGTQRVGRGDLKTKIKVISNDELGLVTRNFNQMINRLREITISRNELGVIVDERTRKLRGTTKRLIRTERFAAAGQLATTVAHEINSPLQGITSMISLMKETHQEDPEDLADFEAVETGLKSIKSTVKNLMDLNRPSGLEKKNIHINNVIEDTSSLFHAQVAKRGGKIQLELAPDLPPIFASAQLLSHVFINFINNAMEAMDEEETSRDENTKPKVPEITITSFQKAKCIVVEFKDNGPGIKAEVMPRLFTPFFTTKKQLGMGVGLSICTESVQEHGGTLHATNRSRGGAVFTITLPTDKEQNDTQPATQKHIA